MREIEVNEKHVRVGLNDYVKLHESLIKSKNLSQVFNIIDKFNIINYIEKNTYFQGIKINESFVYIITNTINKKKYIGETKNLISRMYAYSLLNGINNELKNDIIKYGSINFKIEIKLSNNRKVEEKKTIKKYKDNCYNIIHAEKKISFKKNNGYDIGNYHFKTKDEIRKHCRKVLDSYKLGTELGYFSSDFNFARNMAILHPSYDGFLDKSEDVRLFIIKDNSADAYGVGKWNIFNFRYTINNKEYSWGFSTNKVISNL